MTRDDRLQLLLRALLPPRMAEALGAEESAEFVADMVARYLKADTATQADIRAFFDSSGPDLIADAREREAPPTGDPDWPPLN